MLHLSFALPLAPASDFTSALALFFALLIGHAFADFPLQGEFIALGKNRHAPAPKLADGEDPPKRLWIYLMSAHCLVHAGFVWAITGSAVLALAEFVVHWLIDAVRCDGKTNFETDQGLHILTKIAYVAILMLGWLG